MDCWGGNAPKDVGSRLKEPGFEKGPTGTELNCAAESVANEEGR